jgi:hypothetical protein
MRAKASEVEAVRAVLAGLEPGWSAFSRGIAEDTGLTEQRARYAARALVRAGHARVQAAFDDTTGLVCGRGYALTAEGRAALRVMTRETA